MQKEILIAIITLITIVIINAISQNYTIKSIEDLHYKLEEIKEMALALEKGDIEDNEEQRKKEELGDKLNQLKEHWKTIDKNMSLYVEHDELEKVNSSLIKVSSYISLEEYTEGIPELENCIYILEHIKQKQSIQIINLF